MRYLLAAPLLILLPATAFASGGIWCETETTPAKIDLHSGVGRGMGGPLFNFEGRIAIADEAVPADIRSLEFKQEHVTQYWFDGGSLSLVLYNERDAGKLHGSVELRIETKALEGDDNEGSYAGSYTVTVNYATDDSPEGKQVDLGGSINCFAD